MNFEHEEIEIEGESFIRTRGDGHILYDIACRFDTGIEVLKSTPAQVALSECEN